MDDNFFNPSSRFDYYFSACEYIMGVDILLNFFMDYYDKEAEQQVRQMNKIIINYITSGFVADVLALIPFIWIINSSGIEVKKPTPYGYNWIFLLAAFKFVRFGKATYILSPKYISSIVKKIFETRRNRVIHRIKVAQEKKDYKTLNALKDERKDHNNLIT